MTREQLILMDIKNLTTYDPVRKTAFLRVLDQFARGSTAYIMRLVAGYNTIMLVNDRSGGYLFEEKRCESLDIVAMDRFANTLTRSLILDYLSKLKGSDVIINNEGRVTMSPEVAIKVIRYLEV